MKCLSRLGQTNGATREIPLRQNEGARNPDIIQKFR
jgi:hypothetical protein